MNTEVKEMTTEENTQDTTSVCQHCGQVILGPCSCPGAQHEMLIRETIEKTMDKFDTLCHGGMSFTPISNDILRQFVLKVVTLIATEQIDGLQLKYEGVNTFKFKGGSTAITVTRQQKDSVEAKL